MKFCLVVQSSAIRESILACEEWCSQLEDQQVLNRLLKDDAFFIERGFAEKHPEFQQIIPYTLVVTLDSGVPELLVYQRSAGHDEERLGGKWSVGFGGHIDPGDDTDSDRSHILYAGMNRELGEELGLEEWITREKTFILHRNIDEVDRVHLGIVHVVEVRRFDTGEGSIFMERKASEIFQAHWMSRSVLNSTYEAQERDWEGWTDILLKKDILAELVEI